MTDRFETIVNEVTRIVTPAIEELGLELVDVEYLTERGRWVLRIYIDKPGGVTLDDCVDVSNEVGDLIEIEDIIHNQYVLEVSSPGLDRPLKREKDFLRSLNKKIKIKTKHGINGRKNFTGILRRFEHDKLELELEKGSVVLPMSDIAKANMVYEADLS